MFKPKRSPLENDIMQFRKPPWKNPEGKHLSYVYLETTKKPDLNILDELLRDLKSKKSKSFRNHTTVLAIKSPDLLNHIFKTIDPFSYSKKNEILIEYLFENFGNVFDFMEIIKKDANNLYESTVFKICFRRQSKLREYLKSTPFMKDFIDRLTTKGKTKNSRHIDGLIRTIRKDTSVVMASTNEVFVDLYDDNQQYKNMIISNRDVVKNYRIDNELTGFGFDIYETVISSLPRTEIDRIILDLPDAKKKFFSVYVLSKNLLRKTKLDTFEAILEKLTKENNGICDYCEILVAYEILFTLRTNFT